MRKNVPAALLFVFTLFLFSPRLFAQQTPESLGWKPGVQVYSFRMFTLEEALNKTDSIGVRYIQGFPQQRIGAGIEGNMDYRMPASRRDSVLQLLKRKNISMVSYGVVSPNNEKDWIQLFDFLKAMGMKQFATEPDPQFMGLVSQLAEDYSINVAIHNHPRPSRYWHPDTLIKYTAGFSKRIGSCADIGHWVRSGLDPVAMMKKLEGRIFELHMKDMHEKPSAEYTAFLMSRPAPGQGGPSGAARPAGTTPAPGAATSAPPQAAGGGQRPPQGPPGPHDVPWGTGVSNIKAVLEELRRQKFQGPFFAEYEYNWGWNAAEIGQSIKYVSEVAKGMK